MIVRKKLKPLRKGVQTLRFINFTGIYKQLFTDASWGLEKNRKNGMTFAH